MSEEQNEIPQDRSVIGVYHLVKTYGEQNALDDVNFSIGNGEFVFLVGPSGSGKSTLLRMIYMDEYPTSGQVVVGNFVSTRMKRRDIPYLRRRVGIVFQDYKLLEDRSVAENIGIGMRITGASSFSIKRRVAGLLNDIGLYHKRNENPQSLSGGEQQRVAIARALVNHPAILVGRRAHRQPRPRFGRRSAAPVVQDQQRWDRGLDGDPRSLVRAELWAAHHSFARRASL